MGPVSQPTDSDDQRAHRWRATTRELVLVGASAMASADQPQSQGSISITVTGKALSNELCSPTPATSH
jgi:hypothetical protein